MRSYVFRQTAHVARYMRVRPTWRIGRQLVARANAERATGNFQAATALYEEALRLAPATPRFLIQYGHCLKEAGDYLGAEKLYLQALENLPDDADLALQLGHLYKLADKPDLAYRHYTRATELRPGWIEADLERSGLVLGAPGDGRGATRGPTDGLVIAELLPLQSSEGGTLRAGFHMLRVGATRARTRGGYRRVLRGVEALRGYVISSDLVEQLHLTIDGVPIRDVTLNGIESGAARQFKHTFNIWHDFSGVPVGPHEIGFEAGNRSHREYVDVLPPDNMVYAQSDAVVTLPASTARPLEDTINALPSIIRPARRSLLPHPPQTILVQRVDQLGDLCCSVPALRRLKQIFPEARIIGLVTVGNAALAADIGMFDDLVVANFPEDIGTGRRTMSAAQQQELRSELTAFDFDLAIDLGETAASRPLLLLSGAPFLAGFKGREFPWLTAAFDLATRDPGNGGEMAAHGDKLLALIESLGAIFVNNDTALRGPVVTPVLAAKYRLPHATDYAVLHTGARLPYSRWPHFAALAASILAETDLSVAVMGDAGLPELPTSDRVTQLVGLLPFTDFDAIISSSTIFVGNDSGPKHLAALRGVHTISLHMARVNYSEWGQTGCGAIISRRVPCAGCGIGRNHDDCGQDFACIENIRPDEVMQAVLALLPQRLKRGEAQ